MKKVMFMILGLALLLSSCGTYTGSGAYVGSNVGAILGSAVGGITGGGRGADLGTIVGMAGGAVVGAAIGSAADQKVQERESQEVHDHYMRVQQNKERGINPYASQTKKQHAVNQYDSVYIDSLPGANVTIEDQETISIAEPTVNIVDETNSGDDRIEFE